MGTIQELSLSDGNMDGLFVRIVKKRVPTAQPDEAEAPSKLGVGVEGGFDSEDDKFEIKSTYSLVALQKDADGSVKVTEERLYSQDTKCSVDDKVIRSVESVINHAGMAVQQDIAVWQLDDEPKPVSKHAAELPFLDNGKIISPDPSTWKCEKTGDTENLWLNLSDGFIGGGRRNWDGSGGSNGALDHFEETGQKYPLVVKLGTITADIDTADCYSYAKDEDGPVKIPNLAELLEKRGIKVSTM
jgi:ubiquitin carboxyl-terminal hydrolase 5/13